MQEKGEGLLGRRDPGRKAMGRQKQMMERCSYKLRSAKDCWEPPDSGKKAWDRTFLSLGQEQPFGTLILDPWSPELGVNRFLLF